MDFRVPQELNHPVDRVFETYRDRLVELVPFLDEIESIEVLERREEGSRTHLLNRWRASTTTVPALVRPFLPSAALSWLDRALWDPQAQSCTWEFELSVLTEAVRCSGVNTFRQGPRGSILEITGTLGIDLRRLHVPALFRGAGPRVERYLIGRIRPNLEAVGRAVDRFLSEQASAI